MSKRQKRLDNLDTEYFSPWMLSGVGGLSYETNPSTGLPIAVPGENSRTIEVSPDFAVTGFNKVFTIAEAVTNVSSLSPSQMNPAFIKLHVGVHFLTQATILPEGVSITGVSGLFNTIIAAVAPMNYMFQFTNYNEIASCMLNGNLLADVLIDTAETVVQSHINCCALIMYNTYGCENSTTSGSRLLGSQVLGSTMSGTSNYLVSCDGVNSFVSMVACGVSGGRGFAYASNSAYCQLMGFFCDFLVGDAITCLSSGNIFLANGNFQNCNSNPVFYANTGGIVEVSAVTLSSKSVVPWVRTWRCGDTSSRISMNGVNMSETQNLPDTNFTSGLTSANVNMLFQENNVNNTPGLHVYGDVAFGHRALGSTCYFGQGGINQQSMKIINYDATNFPVLDITDSSKFSGASSKSVPSGFTGTYTVITSKETYPVAVVYNVFAANNTNINTHVLEYYGSGGVWVNMEYCCTTYDPPYTNYGKRVAGATGWMMLAFDYQMTASNTWISQNFGDSGVGYHFRIRVTSGSVTPNSLKEIYTLSNCTFMDQYGYTRKIGRSRGYKILPYDINLVDPAGTLLSPTSADIWLGSNMGIGRFSNRFQTNDSLGTCMFIPGDADLSSPIKVTLMYAAPVATAALPSWTFSYSYGISQQNTVLTAIGGSSMTNSVTSSFTVTPHQTAGNLLQSTTVNVYLNQFSYSLRKAGGALTDMFCFNFQRTDANAQDCIFVQITFSYCSAFDGIPAI